ncbi:hypothetical protein AUJ68_04500 [Candidatus Woesearchaeota archaeon CG1_02_57_44]|nr:MAG: hypothetical protein AUJ68_04500 [Candidatus Woesearchaeota archaeon CG1_02_57_44]
MAASHQQDPVALCDLYELVRDCRPAIPGSIAHTGHSFIVEGALILHLSNPDRNKDYSPDAPHGAQVWRVPLDEGPAQQLATLQKFHYVTHVAKGQLFAQVPSSYPSYALTGDQDGTIYDLSGNAIGTYPIARRRTDGGMRQLHSVAAMDGDTVLGYAVDWVPGADGVVGKEAIEYRMLARAERDSGTIDEVFSLDHSYDDMRRFGLHGGYAYGQFTGVLGTVEDARGSRHYLGAFLDNSWLAVASMDETGKPDALIRKLSWIDDVSCAGGFVYAMNANRLVVADMFAGTRLTEEFTGRLRPEMENRGTAGCLHAAMAASPEGTLVLAYRDSPTDSIHFDRLTPVRDARAYLAEHGKPHGALAHVR